MSAPEDGSDTEAPKSEWADIKFKVAEAEFTVNVNVGGNGGEEDGQVDPNFFDPSHSIEASTGFAVWDACWVLVDMMRTGLAPTDQHGTMRGQHVVELGAGTGIVSLTAAALGASVISTDLQSVVEGVLEPNFQRNRADDGTIAPNSGSCVAAALDWFDDPLPQLGKLETSGEVRPIDVVLAADTVWLKELVDPFAQAMSMLVRSRAEAVGYMAFYERSKETSKVFARPTDVVTALKKRGCTVTALPTEFMAAHELPLHLLRISGDH